MPMAKRLRRNDGRLGRHVFGNVVVVEELQGEKQSARTSSAELRARVERGRRTDVADFFGDESKLDKISRRRRGSVDRAEAQESSISVASEANDGIRYGGACEGLAL